MRSMPTITKNLLIINVLVYLATFVFARIGIDLNYMFGLHFFLQPTFRIYQLFTYMFMHGGIDHIFFNMFALWMFGCVVENVWGPKKFLFYYISCGVGAGLMQELVQFVSLYFGLVDAVGMTVGASGAIYAVLLAFGMIFPNERIFIFPLPVPIKAKWFVCGYAAIELFLAVNSSGDGVAHFAHLGGMLFGYLMIRYWNNHPSGGNYGRKKGQQFFDRLRNSWEQRSHKSNQHHDTTQSDPNDYSDNRADHEYNARKQASQEEIDRILDKIRRSGYDSLSEAEKKKLFDAGNK